jgi:hypothetical protein
MAKKSAIQKELDEFKSQCEIGLAVNHDCPAVYALAYILGQIDDLKAKVGQLEAKGARP